MNDLDKASIRRAMRACRRALGPEAQRAASRALARRLDSLRLFGPGRRAAFYLANDGEIDPGLAMRRAAQAGTCCLVPVVPSPGRRRLRFAPVYESTRFRPNRFGIDEPVVSPRSLMWAIELDVIFVPLVAFDATGNRLGMGGGFYDTTLAARNSCRHFRRPRVIGLAHDGQRVDGIAVEPWDIPLDRIVTDREIYEFGRIPS